MFLCFKFELLPCQHLNITNKKYNPTIKMHNHLFYNIRIRRQMYNCVLSIILTCFYHFCQLYCIMQIYSYQSHFANICYTSVFRFMINMSFLYCICRSSKSNGASKFSTSCASRNTTKHLILRHREFRALARPQWAGLKHKKT